MWGAAAVAGALVLGFSLFGILRLLASAVFLHAALLLIGFAVVLRRSHARIAAGAAVVAAAVIAVGIDAFLVEPEQLEVSHYRMVSAKIPARLRIAVVADLQTDRFGRYEEEALARVLEEKPDLILLAGDYVQAEAAEEPGIQARLNDWLRQAGFDAPLGVFAVGGNSDDPDWPASFRNLPITVVRTAKSFEVGPLRLSCLDVRSSRNRELTLSNPTPDRFHVVLGHAPDFALGAIEADLLVAGHTHGGQVRLPRVGPLWSNSRVPCAWAAGLTRLPSGGSLFVSRGIGMERGPAPRMRFLCRPEIAILDLLPEGPMTSASHPARQGLPEPFEWLFDLHQRMGKPGPGDWLAVHPERAQSYAEYVESRPVRPDARRRALYVQPLGGFSPTARRIVEQTAGYMQRYFGLPVKLREELPLSIIPPQVRRRHPEWNDEQILSTYVLDRVLLPRLPDDAVALVAFTTSDLWPGEQWNFVFGQASLEDRVGVWSLYRYGDPEGGEAAYRQCLLRTIKVGTHETGHMFSIPHCVEYECNMAGSNHLAEMDRRPAWLCPICLAKLSFATGVAAEAHFTALEGFCHEHGLEKEAEYYRRALAKIGEKPR